VAIIVFETKRFEDERGWFSETYSAEKLRSFGIKDQFVQDNQSVSVAVGTLRGLHFQTPPHAQAKLVRCAAGRFLDVVVDVRQGSPTYGNSLSIELTAEKGEQLYIPEGFAHGFVTLVPNTEIFYKVSSPYAPKSDGGIHWNDPSLGINWPLPAIGPITSPKDQQLPLLSGLAKSFTYDGIPLSLKRVSL